MKREEGFYWVKWVGDWIVAQWVCTEDVGCWRTTISYELLEDNDFEVIDTLKIKTPENKPVYSVIIDNKKIFFTHIDFINEK